MFNFNLFTRKSTVQQPTATAPVQPTAIDPITALNRHNERYCHYRALYDAYPCEKFYTAFMHHAFEYARIDKQLSAQPTTSQLSLF